MREGGRGEEGRGWRDREEEEGDGSKLKGVLGSCTRIYPSERRRRVMGVN